MGETGASVDPEEVRHFGADGGTWWDPAGGFRALHWINPTRLGFIANEWRYAPGDPIGAHAMRVYIDGQLVREFKFNIEDGPGHGRPAGGRTPTT